MRYFLFIVTVTMRYFLFIVTVTMSNLFLKFNLTEGSPNQRNLIVKDANTGESKDFQVYLTIYLTNEDVAFP